MTEPTNATNLWWYERYVVVWMNLSELINLLLSHACGIVAIVGLIRGLEYGLRLVSPQPLEWEMGDYHFSLTEIVHYGDLVIFLLFFAVAILDVWRWVWRR
jgi:hypothetical protein